ncbi:MAG TPA: aminoacyl-tRNA hydrolase [Chloroflexi bacterium]|nr:aminoacyl-tRNA hydrolase [Chloroflexota bacterium]
MNPPRLIVGLGNPTPRHARNRHNIGFRVIEAIAASQGLELNSTERNARVAHGLIEGQRVILAQPQTWMNESGRAVGSLARFYRISPTDILVIYDDLDIPLGTVRYRASGSSGGHRGVQSIIQHLGTDAFPRLRIGIGRPPGRMDPAAYVLQNFSADEEIIVNEVVRLAAETALAWLRNEPDLQRTGMTWRLSTPV